VRVYLTLNTLVTDRELPQAAGAGPAGLRPGVDAVLVQDLGLLAAAAGGSCRICRFTPAPR
jgi:putative protease